MRVWITGFGPFPGAPINPSARLAEHLSGVAAAALGATELHADVLPTAFEQAPQLIAKGHRDIRPDVAVHFGLAASASAIRLERIAVNDIEPGRQDATGAVAASTCVEESGPGARRADWPEAVLAALGTSAVPAGFSDDAGRYVCNAVYYRSLGCAVARPGARAWFVHVPHSHQSAAACERTLAVDAATFPEADLADAAAAIVRALVGSCRSG